LPLLPLNCLFCLLLLLLNPFELNRASTAQQVRLNARLLPTVCG
jgi:hypothetical protein